MLTNTCVFNQLLLRHTPISWWIVKRFIDGTMKSIDRCNLTLYWPSYNKGSKLEVVHTGLSFSQSFVQTKRSNELLVVAGARGGLLLHGVSAHGHIPWSHGRATFGIGTSHILSRRLPYCWRYVNTVDGPPCSASAAHARPPPPPHPHLPLRHTPHARLRTPSFIIQIVGLQSAKIKSLS